MFDLNFLFLFFIWKKKKKKKTKWHDNISLSSQQWNGSEFAVHPWGWANAHLYNAVMCPPPKTNPILYIFPKPNLKSILNP